MNDLEALTRIELDAYEVVYGIDPTTGTVEDVREKYRERIELLGDSIRVLEAPDGDVYGMLVGCQTNRTRDDLLSSEADMTDNVAIRNAYDPNGKNAYVVNLAIRSDKQGSDDSLLLFADALEYGVGRGVEQTYFVSRLPGFGEWLNSRSNVSASNPRSAEELDTMAAEYWQTMGENGMPIDSLLRFYVGLGAEPLKLVSDAWKVDHPSKGYGVLCEYEMPKVEAATSTSGTPVQPEAMNEAGEVDEAAVAERGLVSWLKQHKSKLALSTALASTAYATIESILTGGSKNIVHQASKELPWIAGAYTGSWVGIVATAGAMLLAAGRGLSFEKVRHFKRELPYIAEKARESRTVKAAFWGNAVSALGAASIATVGILEALPPSAWGALAIPAADIYSTVVLRKWLYGKIKQVD
jgi:hypothetical protein